MTISKFDILRWAGEYHTKPPQEILALALERFKNIAISFSGAEDVVLVEMASKIKPGVQVFSLDTGRLHPETYRLLDRVREQYDIVFEVLFPNPAAVEKLVGEKGLFSFYKDGHKECCGIRKVAPLCRKLQTLEAWVTGQRKDQSSGTRTSIAVLEEDKAFSTKDHLIVKCNPLANWTSSQVWQYIRDNGVPYNELHAKGYISIGCEPCTRPVLPNQHEREGRWWWEEETIKECGLHSGNVAAARNR